MALWTYLMLADLLDDDDEPTDLRLLQRSMRIRRLNNFTCIVQRNPKLYWPAIFRFLTRNKTLVNRAFMREYPRRFLNSLLLTGCSDLNLVKRIIKLYAAHLTRRINNRDYNRCYPSFAVFEQICCGDSDTIDKEKCLTDVEMITSALEEKDLSLLSALLKYGFCNIPHEVSKDEYPGALKTLTNFWYNDMRQHGISLQPQTFDGIFTNQDWYPRGIRRVFSTVRVIDLLRFHRLNRNEMDEGDRLLEFENHLQCLRWYFWATVEPLITKEDIVELLSLHFRDIPEDFLEDLTRKYESVFPEECAPSYAPRSLKHLCRIQFRRYVVVQKGGILPEVTASLGLPRQLESYLLCSS